MLTLFHLLLHCVLEHFNLKMFPSKTPNLGFVWLPENMAAGYYYVAIWYNWYCRLDACMLTNVWYLWLLVFRIFLDTMNLGVRPSKMSSVQKVYVKQQCLRCLSRKNSRHGLSKVPEIGVGWLFQKRLEAAGMRGWGMPLNASLNGMKIGWWAQGRRIYLIKINLLNSDYSFIQGTLIFTDKKINDINLGRIFLIRITVIVSMDRSLAFYFKKKWFLFQFYFWFWV